MKTNKFNMQNGSDFEQPTELGDDLFDIASGAGKCGMSCKVTCKLTCYATGKDTTTPPKPEPKPGDK